MSIEAELRREFDHWEKRENVVVGVLPYLLLAAGTVLTLLQPLWDEPAGGPAVLGLALATAVWIFAFHGLRPTRRDDGRMTSVYYAGLMAAMAGLVVLAPSYGIFTFTGYLHAFLCLSGGWRYVGVAVTASIAAVSYVGGLDEVLAGGWWDWLLIATVITLLSGAFFHFSEMSDRRDRGQKKALTELHETNLKLEAALAENAGLHARLLTQAREAGVMDERQRMAREIHDTLAQGLAGILAQLQAAEQTLHEPSTVRRHLTTAMTLARESLTEARRTVHAVGPAVLAESRLPDAIRDLVRRWAEENDVDATLTVTGDARPMHADIEVALLRTAQEALTNVAKHAAADRVVLTLSYMADVVTLDVRDDGVGFDPHAERATGSLRGGHGLVGMRQRVQRLAGRLDVESEPGGGTAISATVPAIPAEV